MNLPTDFLPRLREGKHSHGLCSSGRDHASYAFGIHSSRPGKEKSEKTRARESLSQRTPDTLLHENLHKRLKNALERDLSCQVDITIDRDEDAPKREYVPLATLKKQTEAEAKKLKGIEQKLGELEQTTADLAAIELIQPKKVTLSRSRVSVTQEEFETLSSQAKAYAVTKETLQKRSKSLIAREQNVSRREALLDSSERLVERNKALTAENLLLRKQLSTEKDKNIKLEEKFEDLPSTRTTENCWKTPVLN